MNREIIEYVFDLRLKKKMEEHKVNVNEDYKKRIRKDGLKFGERLPVYINMGPTEDLYIDHEVSASPFGANFDLALFEKEPKESLDMFSKCIDRICSKIEKIHTLTNVDVTIKDEKNFVVLWYMWITEKKNTN